MPSFTSSAMYLIDYDLNGKPWTGAVTVGTDSPEKYSNFVWNFYYSGVGVPVGSDPAVGVALLKAWKSWNPSGAIAARTPGRDALVNETNEMWQQTSEFRSVTADRQSRDVGCLLQGYYHVEDNSQEVRPAAAPVRPDLHREGLTCGARRIVGRMRSRSAWAGPAVLVALLFAGLIAQAEGAARPPLPAGSHVVAPGQPPRECTVKDAATNAYGTNFGYYWSNTAKTWISAPWCYPRWGHLKTSASQITSDGGKVTVTAIPTEGSNSGEWAPKTKSIAWTFPGTRVAGCGNADLTLHREGQPRSRLGRDRVAMVRVPRLDAAHVLHRLARRVLRRPARLRRRRHPGLVVRRHPPGQLAAAEGAQGRQGHDLRPRDRDRLQRQERLSQKGLPGVTVTATGRGGSARDTTGPEGNYSIQVEKGTWKVTPSLGDRDFDPATDSVSVSANGHATASFRTCALARTTQSATRGPARQINCAAAQTASTGLCLTGCRTR